MTTRAGLLALGVLGIALASCSPATQPKSDVPSMAETVAHRVPDVRLIGAITTHDYRRNLVLSPYGLRRLFAMLAVGARGRTHDQIVEALGVDEAAEARLPLPGFRVRDGMWIDRRFRTLRSYESAIRERFGADIAHVDFGSPDAVPRIERWVSRATDGQVPRIPLPADLTFVAADALVYHVEWSQPFALAATKPEPFNAVDGTMTVPMMHRGVAAAVFEDARGRYLRLPFTDGNSMMIALPTKLTASTLTHAIQVLDKPFQPMDVELALPRFSISSHVDLVKALLGLGVTSAFGADADFSPIFGKPGVGLTFAFQQGAIAVDERGVKMAVVSIVGSEQGPHRVMTFKVDRPFAFVVEDAKTRQILIAGIVARP